MVEEFYEMWRSEGKSRLLSTLNIEIPDSRLRAATTAPTTTPTTAPTTTPTTAHNDHDDHTLDALIELELWRRAQLRLQLALARHALELQRQ